MSTRTVKITYEELCEIYPVSYSNFYTYPTLNGSNVGQLYYTPNNNPNYCELKSSYYLIEIDPETSRVTDFIYIVKQESNIDGHNNTFLIEKNTKAKELLRSKLFDKEVSEMLEDK